MYDINVKDETPEISVGHAKMFSGFAFAMCNYKAETPEDPCL